MEKSKEQLEKELADLKENLRLAEELARLQKSLKTLQKQEKAEKDPEPKIRVANGQLILPKTMTGKKLSTIILPKIISHHNSPILKRIADKAVSLRNEICSLHGEDLTDQERSNLDDYISAVYLAMRNLAEPIPETKNPVI